MAAAVSITWTGTAEFGRSLEAWKERVSLAGWNALLDAGEEVAREVRNSFGVDGGPQIISGALAESTITTDPVRTGDSGWEVRVGPSGLDYIRRVELGKRSPRSAGPHPFFAPGFERADDRFPDIFLNAWNDALPRR